MKKTPPDLQSDPQSDAAVVALARCHADSYRVLDTIPKIAGPAGLILMGGIVAEGFIPTGRVDLLAGGSLMALLGVGIIDINAGRNYLAKAFSKAASFITRAQVNISQPFILAASGLASCVVLGAGEFADYLQKTGVSFADLLHSKDALKDFMASASYPKIMANIVPFLAASALDIPSLRARLDRMIDPAVTVSAQNLLSIAGSMLIGQFALKAGLPPAALGAAFQTMTNLASIGAVFYKTFSPRYFLPDLGRTAEDQQQTLERLQANGQSGLFWDAYRHEMQQRGNLPPNRPSNP